MDSDVALLTIVVPVYNRERLAGPTLECLAAQTLRPLRVVLVDNASTDGTLELLRRWKESVEAPGFSVEILREAKPGAAASRECGLRHVTTEYTMFFDSDDLMAPIHAALAVDAFKRYPEVDIVGWDVAVGDADGKLAGPVRRFYDKDAHWHNLMHGSLSTQRYAARTSLFRRAGGWDPSVRGWDDIELGARLLLLSPRIMKLTGEPTVVWRRHEDSISRFDFASQAGKWEHALRVLRRDFAGHPRLGRYVGLKGAILAGDYRKEGDRAAAGRLMAGLLRDEPTPCGRLLLRAAYHMQRCGLRGVARLLRPFF